MSDKAQSVAQAYVNTWKSLSLASDGHVLSNYGDSPNSWALEYNLYADKLLHLGLVPDDIYTAVTNYYQRARSKYFLVLLVQ